MVELVLCANEYEAFYRCFELYNNSIDVSSHFKGMKTFLKGDVLKLMLI